MLELVATRRRDAEGVGDFWRRMQLSADYDPHGDADARQHARQGALGGEEMMVVCFVRSGFFSFVCLVCVFVCACRSVCGFYGLLR